MRSVRLLSNLSAYNIPFTNIDRLVEFATLKLDSEGRPIYQILLPDQIDALLEQHKVVPTESE
jgi:hypothetical protein